MMLEGTPHIGSMDNMLSDLRQVANKLETMSQGGHKFSNQDIDELTTVLHHLDKSIAPTFKGEKKIAFFEGMNQKIANVLAALSLIQNPSRESASHRNVEQAITSLVSSINSAINTSKSERNLRNLKKLRIGQKVARVERVRKSKEFGKE